MSIRVRRGTPCRLPVLQRVVNASVVATLLGTLPALATAQASRLPVTPEMRGTAQRVAQAGVPLSDLAPNAPDSHTVKPGDTLWASLRCS